MGKSLGAHVIVVSPCALSCAKAKALGADHVIEMCPYGGQWAEAARKIRASCGNMAGGVDPGNMAGGVDLVIEYCGNLCQSMPQYATMAELSTSVLLTTCTTLTSR